MSTIRINIDTGKRCIECGKTGTVNDSPICMTCMTRAISGKPMRSEFGKAYAQRIKANRESKARP